MPPVRVSNGSTIGLNQIRQLVNRAKFPKRFKRKCIELGASSPKERAMLKARVQRVVSKPSSTQVFTLLKQCRNRTQTTELATFLLDKPTPFPEDPETALKEARLVHTLQRLQATGHNAPFDSRKPMPKSLSGDLKNCASHDDVQSFSKKYELNYENMLKVWNSYKAKGLLLVQVVDTQSKRWTEEELDALKEHRSLEAALLDPKLENFSYESICHKERKLRSNNESQIVRNHSTPWSPNEMRVLSFFPTQTSVATDGLEYLPDRTPSAIMAQAARSREYETQDRLGGERWSPEEEGLLKSCTNFTMATQVQLPGRTPSAAGKKWQELKERGALYRVKPLLKQRKWTAKELRELKKFSDEKEIRKKCRSDTTYLKRFFPDRSLLAVLNRKITES
ncbi:MAG: hypothetical protein S4CHLAM37_15250 [Chlamydiia bacterium]|nr:hypothetical protein [Chlamydiia bacterium]